MTLYEVLQQSLEKFSTRTAFSLWRGADVTYSEVGERVKQIQAMLVDADIHPGDRVAILSSSVPNWGVAYFAIASAGYVVVPIMPDFTSDDIDRIVEHSETKALFVSDRLFSKLAKKTADKLNIVIRTKNLGVIAQNVKGGAGSTRLPSSSWSILRISSSLCCHSRTPTSVLSVLSLPSIMVAMWYISTRHLQSLRCSLHSERCDLQLCLPCR